jgi:Protein of unknown function (DUF3307)
MLDLAHPHTLAQGLSLFFALLIGHALADYPLQGEFLALHKNRHYKDSSHSLPPTVWVHCLINHSLIHAGFVWLITGSVVLGLMELVLHSIIDFIKCEKITSFHMDQGLHVACKALYVVMVMKGWV